MLPDEKKQPSLTAQQLHAEAIRQWQATATGDERIITIRSICVLTRRSMARNLTPEESKAIAWMMSISEILSDMALYEPV